MGRLSPIALCAFSLFWSGNGLGQKAPGIARPPGTRLQVGDWTRLSARYVVDPIGPQLKDWPQQVRLLGKKKTYVRSARAIPGEYRFADRLVNVDGRPFGYVADGQNLPSVVYFEVKKITLQPGQAPRVINFGGMPAPKLVGTMEALAASQGLWRGIEGTLERVSIGESGMPGHGRLSLLHGGSVELLNIVSSRTEALWYSLLGERVTVIGRVGLRSNEKRPLFVDRADAVCQGRAPRCGLHPGQTQGAARRVLTRPAGPPPKRDMFGRPISNGVRRPKRPNRLLTPRATPRSP